MNPVVKKYSFDLYVAASVRGVRSALLAGACLLLSALPALASPGFGGGHDLSAPPIPPNSKTSPLAGIRIDQKLGGQVSGDLSFRDESGRPVHLRDYFTGKPIILSLVYYRCPGLCTITLNSLEQGMRMMEGKTLGRDFQVISVSIDPSEKPDLALSKKAQYLVHYDRPEGRGGWHFLTGDASNIAKLADAVGFRYRWDNEQKQFLHPGGIMILAPDGKITQYIIGSDYSPQVLEQVLNAAAASQVGQVDGTSVLYCFLRDPHTGRIVLAVGRALRVAGVLTLLTLTGLLVLLMRRHPTQLVPPQAADAQPEPAGPDPHA